MPINKDLNILFIHIPRTSGTSFEKNILKIECSHEYNQEKITGSGKINNINENFLSLQHLTFREIKKYYNYIDTNIFKTVTIVRHPVDRIISLYFMENNTRNINLEYKHRFGTDYKYYNSFIDFLKGIQDNLKSDNPYFHWLSQYDYLKDENNEINIDHIIYFEQMPNNFEFINENLKFNYFDKTLNNYEINKKFIKERGGLELIYEIYKKDFEFFKYNIEDYII